MTNKQASESTRGPLRPDSVVQSALELLDDKGLAAVSTRAVADRLGVRMNTVLWHVKSKAGLLDLMADAIVAEVSVDDLPDLWSDRVRELIHRYRQALMNHRDGATLVAGTYVAEPHTLRFAEHLVATLLTGGVDERTAVWTTWSLVYFTFGLVQEEQAAPEARGDRLKAALSSGDYPALHRVAQHLDSSEFDARFDHGIRALLAPLT